MYIYIYMYAWPRRRVKQGDMQCVITPCETLSVAVSSP